MAQESGYKLEHGEAFHADSVTVMHSGGKVMIDFKNTTARLDEMQHDRRQTIVIEHDAIGMSPQLAKKLVDLLEDNLEKYEDKYGEIEMPEQGESGEGTEVSGEESAYIG